MTTGQWPGCVAALERSCGRIEGSFHALRQGRGSENLQNAKKYLIHSQNIQWHQPSGSSPVLVNVKQVSDKF